MHAADYAYFLFHYTWKKLMKKIAISKRIIETIYTTDLILRNILV